ncbi:hypothetical protein RHMOL_Rhmol12G0102800 [Rhododendron molle]|uniref:Uncharacterized protein n=1 Tax=Rhododendron molle TaxID=49168 RepID=A0ACC0LGR6_RHOML|nr:hypothetical protein RHMOL_Rhmol12G0102800 [Rhododendron molle]
MAGGVAGTSKTNAPRARKRVEVDSSSSCLKRAQDGSAFTRCEKCNKQLAVALMDLHDCLMESQIMKALDAQKAELERQSDDEASAKRKEKSTEPQPKKTKKEKKAKDPSKPKRPPTAFFLFMDDFRKSYKEANPDCKSVSVVAKEGGERWKSLADEEKMAYVARAAELKAEYGKALNPDNADDGKGSLEMEVKEDSE